MKIALSPSLSGLCVLRASVVHFQRRNDGTIRLPQAIEIAQKTRQFIETEVIPAEPEATTPDGLPWERLMELRTKAKAFGVYGPQLPLEYGGLGLSLVDIVPVFESAGRSLLGPLVLNCSAPDEGNMHLLHRLGTPAQKEKYLRPLAEGKIRSTFCMTEPPPGVGSDPMMIQTKATRDGDRWLINGQKWWSTGADGAAVYLVMARSDWNVSPRAGCTIFLVSADNPGLQVKRRIGGLTGHTPGGHGEVDIVDCEIPTSAVLGQVGMGYAHAQERLGPARLTHCMRWTGVAERALEIAGEYILEREAFTGRLADHQSMQWMVADSLTELQAGKLLVRHAAQLLHQGQQARQETSMAKLYVSEAINRVIDRAIQMCGGTGISDRTPLAEFYREARAFRIYDGASEVHRMVIARRQLRQWEREMG